MKVLKRLVPIGFLLAIAAASATASINNTGFENGWSNWDDQDPSAISGDARSGGSSAKITGAGGEFAQEITLTQNTNYRLKAYIKGAGKLGVSSGAGTFTSTSSSSDWELVSVEFSSGNSSNATIFAAYNGGEGRFDDFSVEVAGTQPGGDCESPQSLNIGDAIDDGTHDGHDPLLAIDKNFTSESRWSSQGQGKWIMFNLGSSAKISAIYTAWFKGDVRNAYFDVEVSDNASNWNTVLANQVSSGNTSGLEKFSFDEVDARYLRIVGYGNSAGNGWNSLIEVEIHGCSDSGPVITPTPTPTPVVDDLDPDKAPSENFDLEDWYLSIPTDRDDNGLADSIKYAELNAGFEDNQYFYTGDDGGMVFKCPIYGYKTSEGTSFTRVELREMLSRGTNSNTKSLDNNWVFSSAPSDMQEDAAGVDGMLRATLAINRVTSTGLAKEYGRVVIGQIHGSRDEPLRLYYRKLPNNENGEIYMVHEPERAVGGDDIVAIFYGDNTKSSMPNPEDGIPLNEKFTYEIKVVGNDLSVTIIREGRSNLTRKIDMTGTGYAVDGEFVYFKAGLYNQNQSGSESDYAQVTFYELENSHNGY